MKTATELSREGERRLHNQHAFPLYFVNCSCERGCAVCAYTGLVSRAEPKQRENVAPAPLRSSPRELTRDLD
jgi:hypothetical protein